MADIVCPTCSTQYRISDSQLAKASKLRCQKCSTVFRLQDHVKTEDSPPPQDAPEIDTTAQTEGDASESHTLEFDLSNIQFNYPETSSTPDGDDDSSGRTEEATLAQGSDLSLDMNADEMTLDFGASEDPDSSTSPSTDFNFSLDDEQEDAEIHDHISATLHSDSEQQESPFSEFSLVGGDDDLDLSDAPTLDFSFSAAVPEADPEDDDAQEWDADEPDGMDEEDEEDSVQPETAAPDESQELGLDLGSVNFGDEEEAETEDKQEEEDYAEEQEPVEEEPLDEDGYDEEEIEDDLSNCCIDSLAMGLPRCELCGRELGDRDQHYAKELQRVRREQLKEELIASEAQIGFSEEHLKAGGEPSLHVVEDFSDVEQALDALADGTFQQKAKKREAKKNFAKTLKKLAGVLVAFCVLAGIVFIFLLPSSHEKLEARYQEFMAQGGEESKVLAQLFLDSISQKDEALFRKLTVIETMPTYKSGEVINVGDQDEETSLGTPGKIIAEIEAELPVLELQISEKTTLLDEYSSKNLSATLLEQRIKQTKSKLSDATATFEEQDAELSKKLTRLRKEMIRTDDDIAEQRQIARKYIDATDQVGKALYQNSISKQEYLTDQKVKLVDQIRKEETRYQEARNALNQKYQPEFAQLEERLATEQALLKEANLLDDTTRSPIVLLSKELEQLTQKLITQKALLEETRTQVSQALGFFDTGTRTQLTTRQQETEFSYVNKNVAANIKNEHGTQQQISIVLRRYQAILPDNTLQSNWLIEKSAQ